jgi:hypothetical protein
MRLRLFGFVLLLTSLQYINAQQNNFKERPSFAPVALKTSEPVIDGNVIDDPVWQDIDPITQLTQVTPNFGAAVSEKTEIRVAYTNNSFLVAVVCYDSTPERIVVSDSRRDAKLNDEDSFQFIIDTYNDQQNGFLFGTNADAKQYDAQIDNEGEGNFARAGRQQGGVIGGTNLNWDASWNVVTQKGEFGWSAEFEIPMKSIRFLAGSDKTWGINFQRNIAKNTEIAFWATLPLGFEIKRVSMAGKMNGMQLRNPKNLKLFPYVIGQEIRDNAGVYNSSQTNGDAGIDLKYSLTPGLTLDLTYNTDFAQVEVDEQQINLDRFNLFFPEKRAFFLENAGQFSVGSPGEVDLFFSRRIGIGENGSVVPIIGGGRISGKVGQTNVGLLGMQTEAVGEDGFRTNFSVARVNHDFSKSRSSLGAIVVGKNDVGAGSENFNNVIAVDGKLGLGKKADITGFIAKSNGLQDREREHAYQFKGNYNWDGWRVTLGYTELGEGFNPEVGFLLRSSFKKPEFLIFKQWRTKNLGPIFEVRPHVSGFSYYDFDNRLISSFLHVDNHWVWPSGFEIHTGINFRSEGVFEPFSLTGVEVPVGEYNHQELQFVMITNPNKPINFYNRSLIGGYYGGSRVQLSNTMNIRSGNKFSANINLTYSDLRLLNGDVNALITGARLSYSFTPKMFVQSLVQYNNITNVTSLNARFGLLQKANAGLYVVLNIVKDKDWIDQINNQTLSIKYSRQIDVL